MKETIIIVVVLIIVIVVGNITQTYLEKTSDEILEKLAELKAEIQVLKDDSNMDSANEKVQQIIAKWNKTNENWSMIIVHEELDNIEISLLELKACIETKKLEDGLKEIEKSMFLVGHIKEKDCFKIKNIF